VIFEGTSVAGLRYYSAGSAERERLAPSSHHPLVAALSVERNSLKPLRRTANHKGIPMLNTMKNRVAYLLCLGGVTAASLGLLSIAASSAAAQVERDNVGSLALSEKSFTKPSQEVDLDFSAPGLIVEVNVKEGDAVEKGQVLARQDISVETANKKTYEIEANSRVEEEYAQKDLELKKVQLQKTEHLAKLKNATYLEVEEARLEMQRADASVKLAVQKRAIAAAQAATEQAKIDLKKIKAPFDGVISKLDTHVGEVATNAADKPAFRVVRNDPLWVDAHLPAAITARLKKGQQLQVRYVADDKWLTAEVLYLQPVVRAGSQTRMVRLQLPNPEDRPAGLEVYVKLPDGSVASGAEAGSDSTAQPRAVVDR
jgi:RND family efflux transporter MFP subunit